MRSKLLAAGCIAIGLQAVTGSALACATIGLPTPTIGNTVTFGDAVDYALPILGLGSVEIWDSPQQDIVIQAGDGPICAKRCPVGEDATALPGDEVRHGALNHIQTVSLAL